MDEKDMEREIQKLRKDLKTYEINKSSLILSIILLITALLGGGILLGSIFESMPLFVIASIAASIPVTSTKFKELEDIKMNIKGANNQIAIYENEIKRIKKTRYDLAHPQTKKKSEEKPKPNYEFKGRDIAKPEPSKTREIPIEFFDEKDFDDLPRENNHKTR